KISPQEIEQRPADFVGARVRVYAVLPESTMVVHTPGRSQRGDVAPPDTTFAMQCVELTVASIRYPSISGRTAFDPKLYGDVAHPTSLTLNIDQSPRTEVRKFDYLKTALLVGGAVGVGALIYFAIDAMAQEANDQFLHDFFAPFFGN